MRWRHTLDLKDVFHDGSRTLLERRNAIVRRIMASRFWDEDDDELVSVVEELGEVPDADAFDAVWDEFYDWCDANRIWVVTV